MKTSRHYSFERRFQLKRLAVVVLAIALLATIAPLSVSSHADRCAMPCCAGGSCSTGACEVSFQAPAKIAKPASHCEHGHGSMKAEAEKKRRKEINYSILFASNRHSGDSATLSDRPAGQQPVIKSATFSKPCSADCCASVASFSQSRRSRDVTVLAASRKLQLPFSSPLSRDNPNPVFLCSELRRMSPPRAPPFIPFVA